MRKVWLLASAVLAFLNFVKSQELARTLYSPRYDNLDIDTILGSNRLVSNYVDCLLSRKPCPPEGKDLKRILPEALRTKCARCSPIQKENALKIITRLYYDYPDQYRALRERWDPSGEYHRRFEEYLRGLQFNQIGGNGGTGGGTGGGGAGGIGSGGNTVVQNGGNDRPVRNDLDRQPATQSSNVQSVVIDPALLGQQQTGGLNPNTPAAVIPSFPPAVAPATERPRPPAPAPVAQILFPSSTNPSSSSISSISSSSNSDLPTTTSTTTSTIITLSGPPQQPPRPPRVPASSSIGPGIGAMPFPNPTVDLTNLTPIISQPATAMATATPIATPTATSTLGDGGDDAGIIEGQGSASNTSQQPVVVPVPVNYYLNITNGGSLTLWMVHLTGDGTGRRRNGRMTRLDLVGTTIL